MQEAHVSGPKEANVFGATLLHCNKLLHNGTWLLAYRTLRQSPECMLHEFALTAR